MKHETISAIVLKAKSDIANLYFKIAAIQESCDHVGVHVKYEANTGNYCKQDNSYWIDWKCPHCEKRWTTDQDHKAHLEQQRLKAVKI